MKKLTVIGYLLLLVLIQGCERGEKNEGSKEKVYPVPAEKPVFNPDEPAPLPEGTPEYR